MRLSLRVALLLCISIALASCGGAGERIAALEASAPIMSNVDNLRTGERIDLHRWESNDLLSPRSQRTYHSQSYHARQTFTLEDVRIELDQHATENGWVRCEDSLDNWRYILEATDGQLTGMWVIIQEQAFSEEARARVPYVRLSLEGSVYWEDDCPV